MKTKATISISLFGPFGSGNLGDAAIQEAVIYNIKKHLPYAQILAFSHNPEDTQARHRIKTFPISKPSIPDLGDELIINKRSLVWLKKVPLAEKLIDKIQSVIEEVKFFLRSYHILKGIDIFIFSGGGQLDDYWGGPWGHPYMLLRWAFLAKITGTKIVFLSVGADSIQNKLSEIFIKRALLLSDYRSYRERFTRIFVENLGIKKRNFVFPDLAYSLHTNGGLRPRMASNGQRTIGISPIAASACPSVSESSYDRYIDELVSLSCWLLRKKYEIVFVPSQIFMDSPVISHVVQKVRERCGSDFFGKIVEGQIADLNEFLRLISTVDMVIASRLHGVLLSSLMCKPILAISCNRKVEILMSDLELPEFCVDINYFNSNDAIKTIPSLDNDRERIIQQLKNKVTSFRSALDQQYKSLFADHAAN